MGAAVEGMKDSGIVTGAGGNGHGFRCRIAARPACLQSWARAGKLPEKLSKGGMPRADLLVDPGRIKELKFRLMGRMAGPDRARLGAMERVRAHRPASRAGAKEKT
ncbi:MAG TPA: hypothetical protein PLL33_13505 [Paracoccus sp. (in: a-proteobacteria)]|nr:hypothetical protein [Paracoccus sp. (in: a-proteobacteria)]